MSEPSRWRFGSFVADWPERQLLRDGAPVPITHKALHLLVTLLARSGRLVGKAELFDSVWAGTVVTDAALSRAVRELRVVLGDDAGAPRYIATVHGQGFRFVHDVVLDDDGASAADIDARVSVPAGLQDPAASPNAAVARARTFGREAETARLSAAFESALGGARQLCFVLGPAGIGKTAFVETFLRGVVGDRAQVALGRCIQSYGTGEPYLPMLEAFEGLARQIGEIEMARLLLRHAPSWLAQIPWLATEVDGALLRQANAGTTPQRMLREAAQALESLASSRPVVLWLEDLHWSDPSTLDLIAWLGGRSEPAARLLVLATLRPSDLSGATAALPALARQLVQRGQALELAIGPIDEPALLEWLHSRVPPAPGEPLPELARFIHRRTEGHALFAVAVLDDLIARGEVRPSPQGWRLPAELHAFGLGMPDSLRQMVRFQIEGLGDDERRLVEAAAVAGTDFCAAAVAAALETDVANVEERALRLLHAGRLLLHRPAVAWPDGTESAGFGFRHALIWQGVYEGAAPSRRADWHRRIAARQQAAYGGQAPQIAGELAMRWEAAREPARAVFWLRRAAEAALARFAYREGADHLQHALSLLEPTSGPERDSTETELLLSLGAAQMAVHGYGAPEVDATYRRALAMCRSTGRGTELLRALRGLWNVALVRSRLSEAQLAADELVLEAAATGNSSDMFDGFAKLGQTALHRGDLGAARLHLEHALRLPLGADDPTRAREAPRVLAYLSWVLWYGGEPEQALAHADEAVATAAAGGVHAQAFALGFSGWLHEFRGEPAATLDRARRQRALAEEHGLAYWFVWGQLIEALALARLAADTASLAAARRDYGRALDAFELQGAEVGVSHFRCVEAELALAAGDRAAAAQALHRACNLLNRNANAYHAAETLRLQGELLLLNGEPGEARARFEAAALQASAQGNLALQQRAMRSMARTA